MTIVDSDQTTRAQTKSRRQFVPDWLKPVKSDSADGTMALVDHLRELRYRVIWSFIAFVIVFIVAIVVEMQYHVFFDVITAPLTAAKEAYEAKHPGQTVMLTTEGVTGPFALAMKMAAIASLIATCPVWIWHIWAFIMPGLLANEKKYTLRFMFSAVPLFLAGVAMGYYVMPKGFEVMMGFNPPGATQINELNKYLTFELQMLLIFGVSFLLPVLLVALNLIGLVRGKQLSKMRTVAVFVCFIFAAVATPSTDPFSMLALSVPMVVGYIIAEIITRAHDRRLIASGELIELDDED